MALMTVWLNYSGILATLMRMQNYHSRILSFSGGKPEQMSRPLQSMPSSMFSFYILPTQKERYRQLGYTRTRTMFTQEQINGLEAKFKQQKYLSTPERFELAKNLDLHPVTVKTWFQNKRMKWKKELQKIDPSCRPTRPKGRPPNHSSHDVEDKIIVD
jgi:BarH-like homeobox protein